MAAGLAADWKQAAASWPVKAGVALSALFAIVTLITAASRPAILAGLREFEIDRTVMAYNLWTARRVDISRQATGTAVRNPVRLDAPFAARRLRSSGRGMASACTWPAKNQKFLGVDLARGRHLGGFTVLLLAVH